MENSFSSEFEAAIKAANSPDIVSVPVKQQLLGIPEALSSYITSNYPVSDISQELRWCLMESPEGDFSRIRVFKELADLVSYLATREGEEVVVSVVRGVPCSLTEVHNGKRYLRINECQAVLISETSCDIVSAPVIAGIPVQADGWLGDSLYKLGDTEFLEEDDSDD